MKKQKQNDNTILAALETLAATFPWDTVDLWIIRKPEGQINYRAILNENSKFGFYFVASASGETPLDAVTQLASQQEGKRDPEAARAKKLAELREQIQKLEAVVLGMPPYRPNHELAEVNPIKVETIDVAAQVAAWEQDVKDNPPKRVI